jgi:peptide/nickel transport system substrate-binding protein
MKRLTALLVVVVVLTSFVAGCAAPTPEVVEKEVIVEKPVVETVVVEKEKVVEKEVPVTVEVEKEKVVEKEVPVTVEVEKEVVVEKVVTPTPVPPPVKKAGPVTIGGGILTEPHLNPIWLYSTFQLWPLILPSLTWFDDQVQPVLALAENLDVNEDATVYTFYLPEEAVWSDGEPLTAEDVAFSYKIAIHPTFAQSSWVAALSDIKGASEYQKGEVDDIEGVQVVDDHTIQLELKEPNAAFLFNTYLPIMPEHILGSVAPEELEQHPYVDAPTVTSGPYGFVAYEPEQYIHLKKKADYWGTEPLIDEIYIKLLATTATGLAQLEAGEVDIFEIPADEVERFEGIEHVDILAAEGIGYYVLHFDYRTAEQIAQLNKPQDEGGMGYSIVKEPKPYLQDKRFRQAMAYAIDVNPIIDIIGGGVAKPIYSSIFGADWMVNPDLNTYDRDLEKAKSLMEEVGVTFAESGTALWEGDPIILVYLSNTGEEPRKLGEVLQQQLGEVGVRVDIKLVTSAAFITAAINGEGDLIRNAGGRFGADPSVSSLYYTCKAGWARLVIGICDEHLDELFQQGVAVSDIEERQKIYWEASAIQNEELPSLFLFSPSRFWGVNKGLGGLKPSADPGYLTWNIEEWYWK